MGLTLITPPTVWPVSLAEAKLHCRVTANTEDALIESYIKAATRHLEHALELSIAEQTWKLTLDVFSDAIELQRGPVISVASVEYIDELGATQTVSTDIYTVDLVNLRQWIVINTGEIWPTTLDAVNVVFVTYTAGMGVEHEIRQAILLLVAHWYANREAAVVATITSTLALAVESLTQPYRRVLV